MVGLLLFIQCLVHGHVNIVSEYIFYKLSNAQWSPVVIKVYWETSTHSYWAACTLYGERCVPLTTSHCCSSLHVCFCNVRLFCCNTQDNSVVCCTDQLYTVGGVGTYLVAIILHDNKAHSKHNISDLV